jgi:RNA 2',3'-cyclic 3'-phosphodiesterase
MSTSTRMRRLFFALWPGDQVRQSIIETFSTVSVPENSRVAQPENLHITLHFVGQVSPEEKGCLHNAANSINHKPFLINLDRLGYFNKAKICWLGCNGLPIELTQLHHDLGASLARCDYKSESREYKPHVTLIRKCMAPVNTTKDFIIPWLVDEFVLVESISGPGGVNYKVIEKYPLA